MSARLMIGAAALALAVPAIAQDAPTADELADRFEYVLVAGDARILPLADDFRYIENGAELDKWDGMWRTLTALEGASDFPDLDYRIEFANGDEAIRIVEFEENRVRGVMAYRLRAKDGKIAEVNVLPIREEFGGDRGGTLTLLQPVLPLTMDGELVGADDRVFAQDDETPAAHIIRSIARYFAFATSPPSEPLPADFGFASDCVRFDNGQRATGVAESGVLDPAQPAFHPYALGCGDQVQSGFYSNYEVGGVTTYADEAGGIGIAFVRLDQPGTRLSFTAPGVGTVTYPGPRGAAENADTGEQFDGRILTNMITPMSVNGVFLFKFDENGAIQRIDAFYRGAPLGWDAGF